MWLLSVLAIANAAQVQDTLNIRLIPVAPAETLAVRTVGEGEPIVLIPGLFGAAYGFRLLTPLLEDEGYQAIIVEPLGIGASSRPKDADYSLTSQAARIAAVCDSMGLRPAIFIAHTISASMAFRLAVQRPELVAGIVSIGGGPTEEAVTRGFRRSMRFADALKIIGGKDLFRNIVYGRMVESAGDPAWITEDVVRSYTADAERDLGATIDAYQGMGRSREPWTLADVLPQIQSPVRLMVGMAEHKGGVPADEVDVLSGNLQSFAIDSIPDVGLYIFEELPAAVVETVKKISRRQAPPPK